MTRLDLDRETVLAFRSAAAEADVTGIAILSTETEAPIVEDVNAAFEQITGYRATAIIGRGFDALAGPRTSAATLEAIERGLSGPYRAIEIIYRADETPLPVDFSVTPHLDAGGRPASLLLTLREATDLVRARAALETSRRFGAVVRRSTVPSDTPPDVARLLVPAFADWCVIHLLDESGSLALAAMAHATRPAPAGAADVDVRHEGIGAVAMEAVTLLHQPGAPDGAALARQLEAMIGESVHAAAAVPIASDVPHVYGTIALATTEDKRRFAPEDIEVVEDIGARLGFHFDMVHSRESLSAALRSRETFLSQASHELRTPVVSIRGYAQLLLRDLRRQTLTPQRLESGLKTIESSAARLSLLTEDLFTVYNRGAATVPLSLTTVRLESYLHDFFSTAQAHLLHGHTLDLSGIGPHGWVSIDMVRFSQVLYNLINNAERFSPPSSRIRVSTEPHPHGIVIAVSDEGQGLLPGEDTAIFDPFYTSRRRQEGVQPGLGISLYISRQIVERHHGRVWAESPGPDQGTTFKVLLPEVPEPRS